MFNRKNLKTKSVKKLKIRLDDFSNWNSFADSKRDISDTRECYNFKVSKGELEAGFGFKKLMLPNSKTDLTDQSFDIDATEVLGIWMEPIYYSVGEEDRYYIFYLDQTKTLFFFEIFDEDKVMFEEFEMQFQQIPYGAPFRINGADMMLFSSAQDQTMGFGFTGVFTYENIPKFISGCWHGNYFFLLTSGDKNKLFYSTEVIANWNDNNKFEVDLPDVRGGLKFLISFQDDLYIFRDYGIMKLSLFNNSSDEVFDIQNIYYSSSYIYPTSISKNGDYIMFASQDGLYSFDGANVKKIDLPFDEIFTKTRNSDMASACYEDKYFLACRLDFDDNETFGIESSTTYQNNAIIVYDIESKACSLIRGVDIRKFCLVKTPYFQKLCAIFRGDKKAYIGELTNDGKFFDTQLKKMWHSPQTDFGYADKLKRINSVTLKPHTVCNIKIIAENGESIVINSIDSDKSVRHSVNILSKSFSFSITSESSNNISCPEFDVSVIL